MIAESPAFRRGEFVNKEHPATIRVSDDQEILAGDTLVYPKTQQFCIADDIRHYFSEGEGYYLVHYHTPQMFPPPPPHHHGHCPHAHKPQED